MTQTNRIFHSSYKRLLMPHAIITLCVIALSGVLPRWNALQQELIIGTLISFLNFWAVCWALKNIFSKKLIAISVSLIVFKWPILGFMLYKLVTHFKLDVYGLIAGLGSLVPAILALAWVRPDRMEAEE